MTSRIIYIAGPYTAATPEEISAHTAAACEWGRKVRALGLVPLVPHVAICPESGLTWRKAMDECLPILNRCDGILMIPGWDRSKGALAEWDFANENAIPIFEDLAELKTWAEEAA